MSSAIATCARCGTPLDEAALGGLCPRCVALDFFSPSPAGGTETAIPPFDESERRVGDYELLEEIARGGMGVVYRARQLSLNREVAIKMILHGVLAGDTAIARLKAEANAVAGLRHPNIVAIHEIGEHQGRHFFSMEFVRGRTLAELVREGPLSARLAATYLEAIAEAVHYAHGRGILHRDLKPSNVLIDEHDQPRVTDFGLAKRFEGGSDLTLTGQVLGTPAYMSPEQAGAARFGALGARSDVYSMGAVLYHLVTGRAPFTGESPTEVLRQVADAEPVAPRLLNPTLPRDLETICLKCLEKEPARRYGSAAQLAEDLGRFLRDEPIHARPVSPSERVWRWCRRKPALASALAACVVILIAGVSGILWQLRETEAARRKAEESEFTTRQNLYAADMLTVQRALDEGDLGTARRLLDAHRPKPGERILRGFEWRYYWRQAQGDQFAILPHPGRVVGLAFSPDGTVLASGSSDGVKLWKWREQRVLAEVKLPPIHSLGFSSDGQTLLIGGEEGTLWKWNWSREARPVVLTNYPQRQIRLACAPTGSLVAVGLRDLYRSTPRGVTAIWDFAEGKELRTLPQSGSCVAFAPDGALLATSGLTANVKVWDVASGIQQFELTNTTTTVLARSISGLCFSSDGKWLGAATQYGGTLVWDFSRRELISLVPGDGSEVWKMAWVPRRPFVVTSSAAHTVLVYNVTNAGETIRLRGHGKEVHSVAASPDGEIIASGGADVRLWSVQPSVRSEWDTNIVNHTPAFSANGEWMACGLRDRSVAIWDLEKRLQVKRLPQAGKPLGFSADGQELSSIVQSAESNRLELLRWDLRNETVRSKKVLPQGGTLPSIVGPSYLLSPRGQFLVSPKETGEIWIWDLAKDATFKVLHAGDGRVPDLDFTPDGQFMASSSLLSKVVKLWSTKDWTEVGTFPSDDHWYVRVAFSPNGKLLATGNRDIRVWDVATRRELFILEGHREGLYGLRFSPDGRTLVSGNFDHTLRLWNLATHREVGTISRERVFNFCFSPDGRTLAGHQTPATPNLSSLVVWRAAAFAETDAK